MDLPPFEPSLWSLAPAVVAIGLAVLTRHVILALGAAVVAGGVIITGGRPVAGAVYALDPILLGAITDADHTKIVLFSLLVSAMVGVLSTSGAMAEVVEAISRKARSRRSAMTVSWFSGLLVFFDDYANCLIVGNTMRPLCDRHRVSREKLAYLVDVTAAPVATVALVSTWVGYEIGLLRDGLAAVGLETSAYAFFLDSIGYHFYSIFSLAFVAAIALSGRDFGPMRAAEIAAQAQERVEEPPARIEFLVVLVALGSIVTLLGTTLGVMWTTGSAASPDGAAFFEVLGNASSLDAMVQGSALALLVALVGVVAVGRLTVTKAMDAAVEGAKHLFEALVVLYLAWSVAGIMTGLGAAPYLVQVLEGSVAAWLLPTLVFLTAGVVAFATGTSFGTMGILMPMVIPLAVALAPEDPTILLAASGSVLAGAVFGDHCSPISDTTVLSSIGSGCEHLAHVRTQLPYALTVAGISIVCGTIPSGLGVSHWILLPVGCAVAVLVVMTRGRRLPDA